MKTLKAFVRTTRANAVVRALEDARAPGITLSRVHGVGYGYDPLTFTLAPSEVNKTPEVIKVEVVCLDEEVDQLVSAIEMAARTGGRGDGVIFVTPVERAIKIRTGEEALESTNQPTNETQP